MATHVDTSAIGGLKLRLKKIEDRVTDPGPLMVSMMKIMVEDNRRGVLAGTDKDGKPMIPVTYRPRGTARKTTPAQRNVANARLRKSSYAGFGMHAAGLHNNLTRREYERLAGPPLAPRGGSSRVITNVKTGYGKLVGGAWGVYLYWDEVVSTRGVPFLEAHFTGAKTGRGHKVRLPRRDLRGVRPEGQEQARQATINWMHDLTRAT